jgi:HEAT repeat protein
MRWLVVLGLGCLFLALGLADAQTPKKTDVPGFIKQLSDKDARVRLSGIKGINEVGTVKAVYVKDAVEPLVAILKKDGDAKCRAEAATTLGAIDPEEHKSAVETLMIALKDDKQEGVQRACIVGLGSLGAKAKDALPILQTMAKDMRDVEKKAREELAEAKDDQAKAKIARAKVVNVQLKPRDIGQAVKNIASQLK